MLLKEKEGKKLIFSKNVVFQLARCKHCKSLLAYNQCSRKEVFSMAFFLLIQQKLLFSIYFIGKEEEGA